jgi:hypothetical protein
MKSSKGSEYEREMCKRLSKWWTQGYNEIRDDIFWRTSQSGGRATTRAKQNISTAYSYGDVTFIDPAGQPFIDSCLLELKRGYSKDISILDFIDRNRGIPILAGWWEKATDERTLSGRKYTMLIFKRDRHKSCVMISRKMVSNIMDWFGDFSSDEIYVSTKKYNLVVMDLEVFLSWCHPYFFGKEIDLEKSNGRN